jgi:hypothetical protein
MTPEELYKHGYLDGAAGKAVAPAYLTNQNYLMGYDDGKGDAAEDEVSSVKVKDGASQFIKEESRSLIPAPPGYEFTGEFRTPQKGELYLTKNGNAKVADTPRNGRKRHLLRRRFGAF